MFQIILTVNCCIHLITADPLNENSESPSELRFAQAKITSFSMYAVICRLKSYKFSTETLANSPEFTCTVPAYPDVSVTVPMRSLPSNEDFTLTMKVRAHLLHGEHKQ